MLRPFYWLALVAGLAMPYTARCQDSTAVEKSKEIATDSVRQFNTTPHRGTVASLKRIVFVPAALIGYGFASLELNGLKNVNKSVRDKVCITQESHAFRMDDYLQYAPGAMVYGLNAAGIKGKNNFRDRTIIFTMSNIMMSSTVMLTKHLTKEVRPDGSNDMSFPSGHTATAFAAAEFLRREYKDVSPWYGFAGYAMAATTGFLRMYNNKHWLGDVVAGAGVGIFCTDLAYLLYPSVQKLLFKKSRRNGTVIMPTYSQGVAGLALVKVLR
jgi:hypothetical protein